MARENGAEKHDESPYYHACCYDIGGDSKAPAWEQLTIEEKDRYLYKGECDAVHELAGKDGL